MSAFPTLFVSHGAPSLVAEQGPARDFLCALGAELPRPRAIVVVSAHWETVAPAVGGAAAFDTIHGFYGFPNRCIGCAIPPAATRRWPNAWQR